MKRDVEPGPDARAAGGTHPAPARGALLRSHLRLLTVATLLPVVVFALVAAVLLAQREKAVFERGARERVLALATAIDAGLGSSVTTLQALATSRSLDAGDLARFHEEAMRVLASQPDWIAVNLASPSGQQILSTLRPFGEPLPPVTEHSSFDEAVRTGRPVITNVVFGRLTQRWDFGVRVPVLRERAVRFVLTAFVDPAAMHRLLAAQRLPPDWVGALVDRADAFVARTGGSEDNVGKLASDSLRAALASGPEGWFPGRTIEGAAVYTPYYRSQFSGWAIALGIPAREVDAAATRAFLLVLVGSLAALALALVFGDVLSRRISRPIAALAGAARALAAGGRPAVPAGIEVRELADLGAALAGAVATAAEKDATQRQLAAVADNASVALFMLDDRQRCTFMNPAAEAMTGFTAAALEGRSLHDAVHRARPEGRPYPIDESPIDRAFRANERQQGEDVFVHANGRFVPVAFTASPIRDGARPIGTIVEVRDITAAKAAERARLELLDREQRARAQAESANRAKDEFLAMLGHELRNPLSAIRQASYVLDHARSPEQAESAKGIIGRQIGHVNRLVDDLLDAARVATGKITLARERFDLAELVRRVMDTARAAGVTNRHRIVVESVPVAIDGDPTRVEQVVSNLVGNAARYTPAGGTITVAVRAEGDSAILSVRDSGVGMSPELLERAFDLFSQGARGIERTQGGLGIGLTLVRRLAELHGGTAEAASDGEGHGSTFTVRLPRAVALPAAQAAAAPAAAAAGRRVLIVEDNDDARAMLRAAVELAGHHVEDRADGASGLAAALALRPDVAVVDLGLPRLDGFEVARGIRAGRPDGGGPLLIALTGYGQPEDQRKARAAGFDRHFTKPVDTDALLRAIAEARG